MAAIVVHPTWVIAGVVIGACLGLIGAGGSVLAVPALVYLADVSPRSATTTSLLIVGSAALIGSLTHARGRVVEWRIAGAFVGAGVLGSVVGTLANRRIDESLLLALFGVAMLAAARNMWKPVQETGKAPCVCAGRDLWLRIVPSGIAAGLLTGFFGIGGGFVIVPLLVLVVRLPMRRAVGTSLAIIAATSAVAFVLHASTGPVDWDVAVTFLAAAGVGAIGGSVLHRHMWDAALRKAFSVALVPLAIAVLVDGLLALA